MGEYAPIIHGEIAGLKIGINSNEDLWKITRELEKESHEGEYLVGFGVGYTKGQSIRERLKLGSDLPFEIKVQVALAYLEQNDHFPKFTEFSKNINRYIENQNVWNRKEISNDTYNTVVALLEMDLLQRALDTIHRYYIDKKALKVVLEFEQLKERLSGIRNKKKKNQIDVADYKERIIELKTDLLQWIESNKN